MAASVPILFARSPAELTLDGNDEMSAVDTSVSSNVEWLERPEGAEAITVWMVKPIPIAVRGLRGTRRTGSHTPRRVSGGWSQPDTEGRLTSSMPAFLRGGFSLSHM